MSPIDIEVAEPTELRALLRDLRTENVRLALLADVTNAVVTTLDTRTALQRLAELVVPRLGDWCVVHLCVGEDLVERVAVHHYETGATSVVPHRRLLPRLDDNSSAPLAKVFRTAESLLLHPVPGLAESDDPLRRAQLGLFEQLGASSAIITPLRGRRGAVLGAITVVRSTTEPGFRADDVPFVEDIARRAAIAIDNALAYAAQREIAEALQNSLLPPPPQIPNLEITPRYYPARRAADVGGDWYDSFPLPTGEVAVIIGDVTGHDLPAAVRMGELRNMLRTVACDRQEPPAAVLARFDQLIAHLHPDYTATAIYGLVDPTRDPMTLRWCNAGHPPPLLVPPDGVPEFLSPVPEPFIGVAPVVRRTTHERVLPPGSTLLLYTDGLVESRLRPIDEGFELLAKSACRNAHEPLDRFVDAIAVDLVENSDDDIAILAIRR